MIIKKAKIDDLVLLLKWRIIVLKEVFKDSKEVDYQKLYLENKKYYQNHLLDDTHTAIFVFDENNIIGCGGICYQDEMPSPDNSNGKNGYLMNIYVLPQYRKKGIGQEIIKYLIKDAKIRHVTKIYLESSKIAKQIYLDLGFKEMKDYMKL